MTIYRGYNYLDLQFYIRTRRSKFKLSHSDSVRYVKSKTTFPKAVQEPQEMKSKAEKVNLDDDEVEDRDEECYENTDFIGE